MNQKLWTILVTKQKRTVRKKTMCARVCAHVCLREIEPVCPLLSPTICCYCTLGSVRMARVPAVPPVTPAPRLTAGPATQHWGPASIRLLSHNQNWLFFPTGEFSLSADIVIFYVTTKTPSMISTRVLLYSIEFLSTNIQLGHMSGWGISLSVQLLMTLSQELSK